MGPTIQAPQGRHVRVGPVAGRRRSLRPDIQGLRTVAVGLVIIYHIWPTVLPGGFVGVDVFFVISGFLIVGSLVRELAEKGTINLLSFYGKRMRRLLPAASVVLVATLVGMVVLLPQSRWQSISIDIIMSGLQVQNWNQAFSAHSYEGATALVSPVQHYWSLAVEEQFYILIPLLLIAGVAAIRKRGFDAATVSLVLLTVVSIASLIHSVTFSASDHDVAYFATSTRIWELGAGGIGALLLPRFPLGAAVRHLAGWAGLAGVFYSALSFSTALSFPGYLALLPVLATVMILASASSPSAASNDRFSAAALLSVRPATFIGDISYSLYLWHWPVVVFYVFHLGRPPSLIQGAVIAGLSLVLATASYYFVEQKFRHGSQPSLKTAVLMPGQPRFRGVFVMALGLLVATSASALVPWGIVEAKSQELNGLLNMREYPGAMAFDRDHPAPVPRDHPFQPDPAVALKDVPLTGKDECGVFDPAAMGDDECVYGAADAAKSMVVVGDSHAAQYVDPLVLAGTPSGWKVRAMVRNGCPFSAVPPGDATTVYHNCSAQNQVSLQRIIALRPGLVVISGMTPDGYRQALKWGWDTPDALVGGYVELLKPLRQAGLRVAVVLDNPYPSFSAPDCVHINGADSTQCQIGQPAAGKAADPLKLAAAQVPGVEVIDLSSHFCRQGSCPAVIGNVLVYRDNHMTNTFAKTLAPVLAGRLGL
ncbi:acyltransferase family protein [Pseudarthrobacter sp. H2]|uniref:acyltransferase family protein n=1 Tax=Pseudarthrobacter sp. H2 TaxID=3418415 RepID=UPI003CE99C01